MNHTAKHRAGRNFSIAKITRAAAALTFAAGIAVTGALASSAAPVNPTASGAVRQSAAEPNSVYSASIVDGQVYQGDINDAVEAYFRAVPNNGVYNSSLNNGIVSKTKLAADVKADLANGTGDIAFGVYNTVIAKIGGPFADNATKVGTFKLEPGTNLVNTTAFFKRTVAGAEGTRPQLALRYGDGGGNAGTIMGTEISATANRELSGATVKTVTVSEPTTVTVWAFGYADDQGSADSGKITADAEVSVVKIG